MDVRRIHEGTGAFTAFAGALKRDLGKDPEDFRAGVTGSGTLVLGKLDGERLSAFAVFQPFTDPALHLGGMIDPDYLKQLEELEDVAIYSISLIHAIGGAEKLASSAAELIGAFEDLLLEDHEEYCLLISLYRKANRKAFPLYRSLGFKKRGGEAYFMELDPAAIIKKYGKARRAEGAVSLKTFAEMDEQDMKSLSRCYGRVFASKIQADVEGKLRQIISKPSFLPELSVIVCHGPTGGEVIGFCFIEKSSDEAIYINAAGLLKEFRGGDISVKSFSWIMENCLNHGYREAVFITASKKLKMVFSYMLRARNKDTLMWYIKCGARDE